MIATTLKQRAILMRLSMGMPGQARQDKEMTSKVTQDENLGEGAGKWLKNLYPPNAFDALTEIDGKAETYHKTVTVPFDKGIGILAAGLIQEYGDQMRKFASQRQHIIRTVIVPKYPDMIEWAKQKHNGTFDPDQYPPVDEWLKKFYFKTVPLPVPDSSHFETQVSSILGTDIESVDQRVKDATRDGQMEILRRMMEPLRKMATKLTEEPPIGKNGQRKSDIVFRDTLVANIRDIVRLAPKMNLTGDTQLDLFAQEMEGLIGGASDTQVKLTAEQLRDDKGFRNAKAEQAKALLQKLEGYRL